MNKGKIMNETNIALTGTTENRQFDLDQHCTEIASYRDLNSILHQSKDKDVSYKETFNGFNDTLKPKSQFSPDREGLFKWHDEKNGNPCIIDGTDSIPQEDRMSTTLMMDGILLDWKVPQHYARSLGEAERYSLVYGELNGEEVLAIQGNWNATINGQWRNWWVYTCIFQTTTDPETWFEEYCVKSYGVNTYDEYSEEVERIRQEKRDKWEATQQEAKKAGKSLVSF